LPYSAEHDAGSNSKEKREKFVTHIFASNTRVAWRSSQKSGEKGRRDAPEFVQFIGPFELCCCGKKIGIRKVFLF